MSTVRIQLRRGTATEWTNADTALNSSGGLVLAAGEMAVETNTRKIKIGDGTSRWSALSYVASDSPAITEIAQDAIDQALSMGSGLAKSYNDSTNTISITIDDTVVALKSYVDSQVGGLENTVTSDYVLVADVGNAGGPAKLDVDGNLLVPKSSIVLEGATANDFETTLTVVDPTADRTITFPDATTTVVGTDTAQTLSNKVLTTPTINGPTITDTGQTPTIHGIYLPAPHNIIFEGTTANDFETTLTAGEPTADRTITLPDASGTVALTSDITSAVNNLVDAAPGALDTLNELAAAIGDDANYAAGVTTALGGKLSLSGGTMTGAITLSAAPVSNLQPATKKYVDDIAATQAENGLDHINKTTVVHGITNTADLAYLADIGTHNSDTTDVHGIVDTAALATKTYVDGAVEAHSDDTTNIHGISNFANLMDKTGDTMTGLLTLSGAPSSDLNAATKKYVDDTKNTHAAVTTSVHGIADTALLATKEYADTAEADAITAAGTAADTKISTAVAALTKSSVGLANVDNTADADKPVSTATQTALDGKASLSGATFTGSVEIDQNLVIDGDLTVNGTAFNASSTSIVIEDNMVQLAHQNAANTVDLGIIVGYNDGAAKHSGLVRDVSDAKWKLFKGVTTEPTTTVDFSEGSLDDLAVNNVVAAGVVFTDGTQTKEGVPSRTPIISKTTNYTLSAESERDSLIEVNSTDPITITIPTNSAVAYPVGTTLDILGVNTGLITIAGDTGVTVNATPGLKLRTQWSSCTLFKRATDSWVVYGDLKA
jgi:hypothetical protein